ncbi:MAG: transcription antitermination protein RfaH [bacterium]|nr:MAG: transcription antitermination protein RfaH [bacterium]
MLNWYLVYTKPKNEDYVTDRFKSRGFELLNPKIKERRYVRRRLQNAVSPLFPCYVFARFDVQENFRLVKYTRGVRKVVGTLAAPAVVPDEIIDSIRMSIEKGQGVIKVTPPRFEPGDEVLIANGPLQGFEAVFIKELKGMERVSVLLRAINARAVVDNYMLAKR